MLAWTKLMGKNDWIAETVIDGKYISNGGKTENEAKEKLIKYVKNTYKKDLNFNF